jgi:hypothetical protein
MAGLGHLSRVDRFSNTLDFVRQLAMTFSSMELIIDYVRMSATTEWAPLWQAVIFGIAAHPNDPSDACAVAFLAMRKITKSFLHDALFENEVAKLRRCHESDVANHSWIYPSDDFVSDDECESSSGSYGGSDESSRRYVGNLRDEWRHHITRLTYVVTCVSPSIADYRQLGKRKCYTCGQRGHAAKDCMEKPTVTHQVDTNVNPKGPALDSTQHVLRGEAQLRRCHQCSSFDHIAKNCRMQENKNVNPNNVLLTIEGIPLVNERGSLHHSNQPEVPVRVGSQTTPYDDPYNRSEDIANERRQYPPASLLEANPRCVESTTNVPVEIANLGLSISRDFTIAESSNNGGSSVSQNTDHNPEVDSNVSAASTSTKIQVTGEGRVSPPTVDNAEQPANSKRNRNHKNQSITKNANSMPISSTITGERVSLAFLPTSMSKSLNQYDPVIIPSNMGISAFGETMYEEEVQFCRRKKEFSRRYKMSKHSTPAEMKRYRIHSKPLCGNISLSDVEKLMTKKCRARFIELCRPLRDLRWMEDNLPGTNEPTGCRMTLTDIVELLKDGVVSPISRTQAKRFARAFTVTEAMKDRRRAIVHTADINTFLHYISQMSIGSAAQYAKSVYHGSFAVTRDLKVSYFQVEIAELLRPYYVIEAEDGSTYAMNVMPMGMDRSTEIMDCITKTIGGCHGYAKDAPPVQVHAETHVDNLCGICHTREDAVTYAEWIDARAAQIGATWNDDERSVHTKGPWCGLERDYEAKLVRMLPKSVDKVQYWLEHLGDQMEAGEILEMFGVIFFATSVLLLDPAKYYFAMKIYRRIASKLSKGSISQSDLVSLSISVKSQIREWLQSCVDNKWTTPPKSIRPRFIMFSDASLTGWGCVIINTLTKEVMSVGDKWNANEGSSWSINVLEVEAVLRGLWAFRHQIRGCSIELHIDNTSCLAAVRRGYSRIQAINRVAGSINDAVKVWNIHIESTHYVHTSKNVSDGRSRGRDFEDSDFIQIQDLLRNIQNRFTTGDMAKPLAKGSAESRGLELLGGTGDVSTPQTLLD